MMRYVVSTAQSININILLLIVGILFFYLKRMNLLISKEYRFDRDFDE